MRRAGEQGAAGGGDGAGGHGYDFLDRKVLERISCHVAVPLISGKLTAQDAFHKNEFVSLYAMS